VEEDGSSPEEELMVVTVLLGEEGDYPLDLGALPAGPLEEGSQFLLLRKGD
jgi:hypothetical protein